MAMVRSRIRFNVTLLALVIALFSLTDTTF